MGVALARCGVEKRSRIYQRHVLRRAELLC